MRIRNLFVTLVVALSLGMLGCDFNGGVEQGRCVGYDADGRTMTLVEDTSLDQHNPHYSGKVFTFKLPADPKEMGPVPEVGGLVQVEPDKNQVLVYNQETKSLQELPVQMELIKDVGPKDDRLKGKTFPVIDRAQQTITVYSPRLEALITFKVSDAELAMPEYTWQLGDEVRVAYRNDNKAQAIRIMNVSKTSIFR